MEAGKRRECYFREDGVTEFSRRAISKIKLVEKRMIEDDDVVKYRADHAQRKYARKYFLPRMATLALQFKDIMAANRDDVLESCNYRWNIYFAAKITTISPTPQDARVMRIKAMKECLSHIKDHEVYWNIRMMTMHARPQYFYGEHPIHNGLNSFLRKKEVVSDFDFLTVEVDLKSLCLDGANVVTPPRLRLLKVTLQVLFPNPGDWKGVFEGQDTMIQCRMARPLVMLFCNRAVDMKPAGEDWPQMERPTVDDVTPIVKGTVSQFVEQIQGIIPAIVSYERFPMKNLWNW